MKKTLFIATAFLAVVLLAGGVYAAQSAAPAEEPAAAPVVAPAASTPAPVPTPEGLEGMIFEPVETDACCWADCFEEYTLCREACNGDWDCIGQCQLEKQACQQNC